MTHVVLVRPWADAHAGSGCCGGDPRHGVCIERDGRDHADHETLALGEVFRTLRAVLPEVDVQVVAASNAAYLLPTVYRSVRTRTGWMSALRHAVQATSVGAVLVDGERVGDIRDLGPDGVLEAVRARTVTA